MLVGEGRVGRVFRDQNRQVCGRAGEVVLRPGVAPERGEEDAKVLLFNDGSITGTGTLRIQEGAELALGGEARLDGTSVTADGTLALSGTESGTISSMSSVVRRTTGTIRMASATEPANPEKVPSGITSTA